MCTCRGAVHRRHAPRSTYWTLSSKYCLVGRASSGLAARCAKGSYGFTHPCTLDARRARDREGESAAGAARARADAPSPQGHEAVRVQGLENCSSEWPVQERRPPRRQKLVDAGVAQTRLCWGRLWRRQPWRRRARCHRPVFLVLVLVQGLVSFDEGIQLGGEEGSVLCLICRPPRRRWDRFRRRRQTWGRASLWRYPNVGDLAMHAQT